MFEPGRARQPTRLTWAFNTWTSVRRGYISPRTAVLLNCEDEPLKPIRDDVRRHAFRLDGRTAREDQEFWNLESQAKLGFIA